MQCMFWLKTYTNVHFLYFAFALNKLIFAVSTEQARYINFPCRLTFARINTVFCFSCEACIHTQLEKVDVVFGFILYNQLEWTWLQRACSETWWCCFGTNETPSPHCLSVMLWFPPGIMILCDANPTKCRPYRVSLPYFTFILYTYERIWGVTWGEREVPQGEQYSEAQRPWKLNPVSCMIWITQNVGRQEISDLDKQYGGNAFGNFT